MDQSEMETQLAIGNSEAFAHALNIYQKGAHSKSVAQVTLNSGLTSAVTAGVAVSGTSTKGSQVTGIINEDAAASATAVKIEYDITAIQSMHVGCQVGGSPDPLLDGCFAAQGELTIGGLNYNYTYNPSRNNVNQRTLQGFSQQAEAKMYRCATCPYVTYQKFYDYYGQFDYGDKWVSAAFNGGSTSFTRGNADFSSYSFVGKAEAIKKGTVFMNVWMYVIRELEDAIDDCVSDCDPTSTCNMDPVKAWDEAAAFYTGSLEGQDGTGTGVMLHSLADKRCANFKTCGDLANEITGTSHVNIEILAQLVDGKRKLGAGQCSAVRANKERIEQLMAVPLVQGTLRYAYITEFEPEDDIEKSEAEGATFAASVLPLVHACDEDAANTIYNSMKVGQGGSADFIAVKRAFQSVYSCMKIRCEDVGGLYDTTTGSYMPQAGPCGLKTEESKKKGGLIVGLSFGGVALAVLAFFALRKLTGSHSNVQPPSDLNVSDKIAA
jgi:Low iron-inducible periplasmic protein